MKPGIAIRNIVVAGSLVILTGTAQAGGLYTPGSVTIGPGAGYMRATFNVRYSAQATSNSFVDFSPDVAMGYVSISARDESGVTFYCYIPSASGLYAKALQVAGTLGNGATLFANRAYNTNECNDFLITVGSRYLD